MKPIDHKAGVYPKSRLLVTLILLITMVLNITACAGGDGASNEDSSMPDLDVTPKVLTTKASGKKTFKGDNCVVDYSNTKKGYIMAKYTGSKDKVKLQLNVAGGEVYNYDLATNGDYQAFPLTSGNGTYTVGVFENTSGDSYIQALKDNFNVKLKDEFQPYLHPSQYVNFTKRSETVSAGSKVAQGAKTELGIVEKVFDYVTENVEYDYDKAASVQPGYLPDIDDTINTKKGICFDYAALTAAMLRTQGIPTKLVIGYAGQAYHAWISVYLKEEGWVDNIIEFHGDTWTLMDPTFASSGDNSDPNVVGDGENYNPLYYY